MSYEQVQGLSAVVAHARVMLESLRQVPDDRDARVELVRLTGAIVGHADREDWYALGDVAGPLVRLLATRRGDPPVFDALEGGLDEIEALISARA
jgi:hypothetical protein